MMKLNIRLSGFIIIVVLLLMFFHLDSISQEPFGIQQVGRLYKSLNGGNVVIRNDIAYVNSGKAGLHIFDLSDPEQITPVVYFDDYQSSDNNLDVQENIAFLTTGYNGLIIFDVTDPENPNITSSFCADRLFTTDVKVVESLAYVLSREASGRTAWLQLLNIDNPYEPLLVGQLDLERIQVGRYGYQRLIVFEDICYVVFDQIMYLIDVADPESPQLISSIEVPGSHPCIIKSEELIITGHSHGNINFFDISNPQEPRLINTINQERSVSDLGLQDSLLFVKINNGIIHVLDISDPENPEDVFTGDMSWGSGRIGLTEDYLLNISRRLTTIDISHPDELTSISVFNTGQYYIHSSHIAGNCAYIGHEPDWLNSETNTLIRIDITDPSRPHETDRRNSTSYNEIEMVDEHLLYVLDLDNDLRVYDVSDWRNWEMLFHNETVEFERELFINGDRCYLNLFPGWGNNGRNGMSIMDISNPHQLEEVYFIDDIHGSVWGDYLFSSDGSIIRIYDISDPDRIMEVGYNDDYAIYWEFVVSNDLLFVRTHDDRSRVQIVAFDVSNPYDPTVRSELQLPILGEPDEMIIYEQHLILTFADEGIYIYDYTVPESPQLVGYRHTPGVIHDIDISGNLLYVADETNFGIYDFSEALGVTISKPMFPETTFINTFYPNPFNDRGVAEFYLHKSGMVSLSLHSITGRQVENLIPLSGMAAGWHSTNFNAKGRSTGTYFLKYDIDGQFYTEPILLLK